MNRRLRIISHLLAGAVLAITAMGCPGDSDPSPPTLTAFSFSTTTFFFKSPNGLLPNFGMYMADLNNDGVQDFVRLEDYWEGDTRTLLIYIGMADGRFHEPRAIDVGEMPRDIAIADVNADGALDIVVAVYLQMEILVLLGDGQGAFTKDQRIPVFNAPLNVVVEDFNGDGRLDFACKFFQIGLSVLLATGDGSYIEEIYPDSAQGGFDLSTGDFNGDAIPDLISVGADVTILFGAGDGTFTTEIVHSGTEWEGVAFADINGDSAADLILDMDGEDDFTTLLNNGAGQFSPGPAIPANDNYRLPGLADLNGDGDVDLVLTSESTADPILIRYGNGDATFTEVQSFGGPSAASPPVIVDIDGDSNLDVLIERTGAEVVVILGRSDGSFPEPESLGVNEGDWSPIARDFNGDGFADLMVTGDDEILVYTGDGDATLTLITQFPTGDWPYYVIVEDLDGDGTLDVIASNHNSNDLSIYLGNGDATFGPELRLDVGHGPWQIQAGDANGDGHPDLIVENGFDEDFSLLLGNGDGTFLPETRITPGGEISGLATGDFDGNGTLDLMTRVRGDSEFEFDVTVLFGFGDGTFGNVQSTPLGNPPQGSPSAADINGDGADEILVMREVPSNIDGYYQAELVVFSIDASGALVESAAVLMAEESFTPLEIVDLDQDGALDVITVNFHTEDIAIFRGDGDGAFLPEVRFTVLTESSDSTPARVVAADFDSDGDLDLAVTMYGGAPIQLLRNFARDHTAEN